MGIVEKWQTLQKRKVGKKGNTENSSEEKQFIEVNLSRAVVRVEEETDTETEI